MALFEPNEKTDVRKFLALMDSNGENMVAIINPVGKVPVELLESALKEKGLKVEVRESSPVVTELKL